MTVIVYDVGLYNNRHYVPLSMFHDVCVPQLRLYYSEYFCKQSKPQTPLSEHVGNMLATSPTDETPTSCTTCPYPVELLYNILLTCVIHTGSKLGLGLALWAEEPFDQRG